MTNIFANQRKEGSTFGIRLSPTVTRERLPYFFPYFLVFLRLLNLTTLGAIPSSLGLYAHCQGLIEFLSISLWLRRVTSIVIPMSLRTWRSGPLRVTTRLHVWLFRKPTIRGHQGKRIPSWMSKHPVFCSILKRLDDQHQYPVDPFGALADFKTILEKAKRQTDRELSRKTPHSLGAKLLTASTVLRAYRNRHLGTFMRCCEEWEPVRKCFDPIFFECIDFHGLSQTIASLTRENLAEREAEMGNLPWTQTEKDNALAKCRLGLRAWRAKKPMVCLHALLENEDESGRRLCEHWSTIFQARAEGPRHHQYENILRYVQKATDDIRWESDRNEFDELMATNKESAPGPDGIPYSFYRCAGGIGFEDSVLRVQICAGGWYYSCAFCRKQNCIYSQVLRHRRQWKDRQITGSTTSVDAVQVRLQDSHHSYLSRPPLVHYEMHTHLAEVYLFPTDDG